MYNFLFIANIKWKPYVESIYSCEGHKSGSPAYIKFKIKKEKWWSNFKNHIKYSFCKFKDDVLYVYHTDKHDLFRKLNLVLKKGNWLCKTIKLKRLEI